MKQYLAKLPVWGLVVILSLLISAAWLTFVLRNDDRGRVVGISGDGSPLFQDWTAYRLDGSLVGHKFDWGTRRNSVYLIQDPTISGLIAFWWPVAASVGFAFLTLMAALMPARGRFLRKRVPIYGGRITLFRVMVAIGTVAAWLWLGRLDHYTRAAGALVFGLMLYGGFRRSFLTKKSTAEPTPNSALSRAGIAGYSLVLLLASLWLISILIWDSNQVVHS